MGREIMKDAKAIKDTVVLETDENGELVLPLTPGLMEELGWEIGDDLVWEDMGDSTFSIKKKDTHNE
jgi:bifunctional DNA-binding transcriptional regulator/antitoxin component of YhaV-PrlF toxin-antitoxin module